MNDFEDQLKRRPMRAVPEAWRNEILKTAQAARTSPPSELHVQSHEWWRELLWPCPQAWAGLVTVWLLILGLHLMAGTDSRPSGQPTVAAISPEWWAVLAEQRRLLAELLPPPELPPIRRPKEPADRPRSEGSRQREFPMTQLLELPRSFV